MALFRDNYLAVKQHNAKPDASYKLSVNQFSDWSPLEFQKFLTFKEPVDDEDDHTAEGEVEENKL